MINLSTTKKREILESIKELEKLANTVLKLKQSSIPRRPIVIEFCGSPKSGKSSSINSLDLFLRRNKFRTKVLTERASVCPVKKKYDPYFNIWTVCSAVASLSEILSNNSKDYDVVILDRGIFDAICWFSWLLKEEHFDEKNYKSIMSFLTMNRWRSVIDLIYVFTANPQVSLEREYANLLTRKMGSIMHPEILESYNETISEIVSCYESKFKKVEQIDTSSKGINEVNYLVTKHILDILKINTSERVGFFNSSELDKEFPRCFEFSELNLNSLSLNFKARPEVEYDINKLQPIPIVVITNKLRDRVLVVKKSKKQTSDTSPESNKILLYLGGHIREEDLFEAQHQDNLSAIKYALRREIKEETGIDFYPNDTAIPFYIWDKSNKRSEVHLAICYIMEIDFGRTKISLDRNEFITQGRTKSGKVLQLSEISQDYSKLEDWSKVILEKVFKYIPKTKQPSLFENQPTNQLT